ncbi:uncharacterized protein EMH_0073900 [Eimeria mitis]|uniref:Uncharacterized protein n=1 Tax=Eimeria mitis TaxID=44415 RepID=U6KBR4_9EIME|nr:uncharacterized protein EMH_0073900 [Eimeria mitis]CDJ35455.1 hypothetical protein, conserved [Eimeria mitis]
MNFFETSYHHFHGPGSSLLASRPSEPKSTFCTPSTVLSPLWGFSNHPPPGVPGPKYLSEDKAAAAEAEATPAAAAATAATGSTGKPVPPTTYGEAFQSRQRVIPILYYDIQGQEYKQHLQTLTQADNSQPAEPQITRLSPLYKPEPNTSLGVTMLRGAAAAAATLTTPASAATAAVAARSHPARRENSNSTSIDTQRPAGILPLAESLRVFPPKRSAYQRLVNNSDVANI